MIVMNVELIPRILSEFDATLVQEIKFLQKINVLVKSLYNIVKSWTIISERNSVLNVSKDLL